MQLQCLINKVQLVGEFSDGEFLIYEKSNIGQKIIKFQSLINLFVNH